jgi:hypothetical protein
MQLKGWLTLFFAVLGVVALYILFREYTGQIIRGVERDMVSAQPVRVVGPINGRVKYLDIIRSPIKGCIDRGFMIFFKGIDNEDFVILTDSIRAHFGELSGNIVGMSFKFEKLAVCRERVENSNAYLLMSPPVVIDIDEADSKRIR